jgi:hypothetical protein
MSWLDEQISKRDDLIRREMLLDQHAPEVYADLWECISKIIAEAETKLTTCQLLPSGSPNERTVLAASLGAAGKGRQMTLRLEKGQRSITAYFDGAIMPFEIGICKDGVVCLRRGDRQLRGQEVAQMIMGPFLFPELHRA